MKTEYDEKADAKYVYIKKGKIAQTKKEQDWLFFDYAKNGDVLGVEILNASKNLISISVAKNNFLGYSIAKFKSPGHGHVSLELIINSPEYKILNNFALA